MVLGDTNACVYWFTFDKEDSKDTQIIQYFVMHGLVLCIKLKSYAAHIFYTCSLGHNKASLTTIKEEKPYIYLDTYTTVFAWGYVN